MRGVGLLVHDQAMVTTRGRQIHKVDGNHVLYHFLQKGLLQEDVWLFQMLTARLVASLGIWLPVKLYSKMPLLTPHAVRDSTSRKDIKAGRPEAWGSPNSDGYFRDDNSLIKGIPAALLIESRFSGLLGGLCKTRLLIHPRVPWPDSYESSRHASPIRSNGFSGR